jgi:NADPH:quinone reductase-like Zn-dependent oxidoreductase
MVVKNHAVAINALECILQQAGGVTFPWITYPFVLGSDVSEVTVEIGGAVTRFAVGDRFIGHAVGTDKYSNTSAVRRSGARGPR